MSEFEFPAGTAPQLLWASPEKIRCLTTVIHELKKNLHKGLLLSRLTPRSQSAVSAVISSVHHTDVVRYGD